MLKNINIYVSQKIPLSGIKLLKSEGFKVTINSSGKQWSEKDFLRIAKKADGLITLLSDKINPKILDELKKCKVISNYAVGFNNIDVQYASQKGIWVTNTPGVLTDATADLTMALILAVGRRITEGDRYMRDGKFTGWKPDLLLGAELKGKTLGIIGAGRIGTAVAERASAFGLKIIYFNRSRNFFIEEKLKARRKSLPVLMKSADIISLHLPLHSSTTRIINKEMLKLMKTSAILVNTARGEILDEKALIQILQKKKIFGAGFDVYENEPMVNKELFTLENVVLAPHTGSATLETRNRMSEIAAINVIKVLSGKRPPHPVNTPVLSAKK